jgi:transposase
MKLRGKKQNSLIVLHEPNSSDPNTFKKNKKKCKKLHNREISQLESNLSSHEVDLFSNLEFKVRY